MANLLQRVCLKVKRFLISNERVEQQAKSVNIGSDRGFICQKLFGSGVIQTAQKVALTGYIGILQLLLGREKLADSKICYFHLSFRGNEDVIRLRSEEHTSELQSRGHLVCR